MISFFDTSTKPTKEMLDAIVTAPLGDDVYGDDPTVNELERVSAKLLGKDAAVLVASGTMANLCALLAWTHPGQEVVLEADAHILVAEAGGLCAVAGVVPLPVRAERGVLRAADVKGHLRRPDVHFPPTSLLCVENSHNRSGGRVTPVEVMQELRELCDERQLAFHVDGARIFDAAVALGVPPAELVAPADSVSFCLSKGLSAPVGSLLVGGAEFIDRARRARKMLGGSMRQAGIIAAAGLVALQTGIDRLAEDHARAKVLAARLVDVPGLEVDPDDVETNFVMVGTGTWQMSGASLVAELRQRGVDATALHPFSVRFVIHREIDDEDVDTLVETLRDIGATVATNGT